MRYSFNLLLCLLIITTASAHRAQASNAVPQAKKESADSDKPIGETNSAQAKSSRVPGPPEPHAGAKTTAASADKRKRVTVHQTVLPLPGELDAIPVFNSNSPEIVLRPGVLLSTFPPQGKAHPAAHLDYMLGGRFDVFFHHVTDATKTGTERTLFLGLLIENASKRTIFVRTLNAVSYATKPDSPFIDLPPILDNKKGNIYAGPGDRMTDDLLHGRTQRGWHRIMTLAPGEAKILYCLPLRVKDLSHPLNGRSGLVQLYADGLVHLASLATFAPASFFGEHKPKINDWLQVLNERPLVSPRDKTPTVPGAPGQLIYGRVAGIVNGSNWPAVVSNDQHHKRLDIEPGQTISFPISTVSGGTLGTNQVQAAHMLARYPDTAYRSNGNYGVLYDLTLPIYNLSDKESNIDLTFQTPLKDWNKADSLQFYEQPPDHIFFRGNLKFEWTDREHKSHQQFVHLVERQGQRVAPLISWRLNGHEQQDVHVSFYYPPDCTPPQVLTVSSRTSPQGGPGTESDL